MTDHTANDIQFLIQQDRKRVQSILQLPEARGREKLASVLAYQANMSIDDARAALKVAPLPNIIATAPEAEAASKSDEFNWGRAVAIALKGAHKRRSRISAEDEDEAAGRRAARRILGKDEKENNGIADDLDDLDNDDDGQEADDGSSMDDLADKERRGRRQGQPEPAAYVPTPADHKAYAQGEAAAKFFMEHGFGRSHG